MGDQLGVTEGWLANGVMVRVARRVADWEPWIVLTTAPLLLYPGYWSAAGFAVIAFCWVCRRAARGCWTIPGPANLPIGLLLVATATGLVPSVDLEASVIGVCRLALGAAIFFAFANSLRTPERVSHWMWLLLAAGPALAILALLGTRWDQVRLFDLPDLYGRLPAFIGSLAQSESFNPRVMGMALALLAPLSLAVAAFGSGRWRRVLCAAMVLFVVMALLLTQSLQALLGLGAAVLMLLIWRGRWLAAIGVAVGLCGAALTVYAHPIAEVVLSTGNPVGIAVALRLDMWARALAMIRDMPFTGIGVDTFPQVQSAFYPGYLLGAEPHAHNLFLQMALDGGMWGLAAWLWVLGALAATGAAAYRRTADRGGRAVVMGLGAGILSFVVSGCVDTLWASKPVVLFWILAGLLAAMANPELQLASDPAVSRAGVWKQRIAGALWAVSLLLALWLEPGLRELNLGRIEAHKALSEARITGTGQQGMMRTAVQRVSRVAQPDRDPLTYELLGSLHAWLGENGLALAALSTRVALDAPDPMSRYAPFEAWRRRAAGEGSPRMWDDALRIYSNWMVRYPDRAEVYVQVAVVLEDHLGDHARAINTIADGIAKGAQPIGLLHYVQDCLDQGTCY